MNVDSSSDNPHTQLSEENLMLFRQLKDESKLLASKGKLYEALLKLMQASAICETPKVRRWIKKIEENLQTVDDNTSDLRGFSFQNRQEFNKLKKRAMQLSYKGNFSDSLTAFKAAFCIYKCPHVREYIEEIEAILSKHSEKLQLFQKVSKSGQELATKGNTSESLKMFESAYRICPSPKVLKNIKTLEHQRETAQREEDNVIEVSNGFYLNDEIYRKLYPHQIEGVSWMWQLFQDRKGGVLGDDMGLGKTLQIIAFLSGIIDANKAKTILIIMPVSLISNWRNEFNKWCPGIAVHDFHSGSLKERLRNLNRTQRRGNVLLTSYGLVVNNVDYMSRLDDHPFIWDYVVLDEGHKIKNPTKTTKAVHNIPSRNRIVLTGTPIQNNLRELWSLYDFTHQGTLLGSLKTFKLQYETPITRSREKDATSFERNLGTKMAQSLKMLIQPYFLRRAKCDIWKTYDNSANSADVDELQQKFQDLSVADLVMTRKNDLIVWIYLSDAQCQIYKSFLHSDVVKRILVSKRSPLVELTVLKKICDHPRLLSLSACSQLGLNGQLSEEELELEINDAASALSSFENIPDEVLIEESGKLAFFMKLLENLRRNGHRTLVFSMSRKILDMIYRILTNRHWKVLRIDGTISKMEERQKRIQLFQNDSSYPVFLLTTQVGGVGFTLTAADRVVIYDPSWNPATDAQAVDRAYRIGQTKNVIVYRFITCGTVEEKIYRRQIFKDSITKQTTGVSDPHRYFTKQELRELFTLENHRYSATQVQLSDLHSHERKTDPSQDEHIAFLHSLNMFGISDHDLMFTRNIPDSAVEDIDPVASQDHIEKTVDIAQRAIQVEASVVADGIRMAGSSGFTRPFLQPVTKPRKTSEKVKSVYKELPICSSENSNEKNSSFHHDADDSVLLLSNSTNLSPKSDDKQANCATNFQSELVEEDIEPLVIDCDFSDVDTFVQRRSSPGIQHTSSPTRDEPQGFKEYINGVDISLENLLSDEEEPVIQRRRKSCVRAQNVITSDDEDSCSSPGIFVAESSSNSDGSEESFVEDNSDHSTPEMQESVQDSLISMNETL